MIIEFDEAKGQYTIDGKKVPRVTTILKILEPFDGYPPEAAKRGSFVHEVIEKYENWTLDFNPMDTAIAGYFKAWLKFKAENPLHLDFLSLKYEVKVGSKMGFAGRVDILNDDFIIDIKTGAVTKTHPHQLAAYNHAAIETIGGKTRKQFCLYLSDDANYQVKIYNKEKAAAAVIWNQFIAALTVTNFRNGGKHE